MSENAKIQITVKFDNIPSEVIKHINNAAVDYDKSRKILGSVYDKISIGDIAGAVSDINDVRRTLNYMDLVLADSINILVGYNSHQSKNLEAQNSSEEPITETTKEE